MATFIYNGEQRIINMDLVTGFTKSIHRDMCYITFYFEENHEVCWSFRDALECRRVYNSILRRFTPEVMQ